MFCSRSSRCSCIVGVLVLVFVVFVWCSSVGVCSCLFGVLCLSCRFLFCVIVLVTRRCLPFVCVCVRSVCVCFSLCWCSCSCSCLCWFCVCDGVRVGVFVCVGVCGVCVLVCVF